jgi:hypothetical protein
VIVPVLLMVSDEVAVDPVAPAVLALAPNQPNPFNPSTTLRFALPAAGRARLSVYDATGRRVAVLVEGELAAGWHQAVWDGRDASGHALASGVYLARLEAGSEVRARKLLLLK